VAVAAAASPVAAAAAAVAEKAAAAAKLAKVLVQATLAAGHRRTPGRRRAEVARTRRRANEHVRVYWCQREEERKVRPRRGKVDALCVDAHVTLV
jgi:hypothetical protein